MTNGIAPASVQDLLDEIEQLNAKVDNWADINAAAGRELKRLQALNTGLLEALRYTESELMVDQRQYGALTMVVELLKVIRAAIAKAEG